ncbi:MAG: hypothetical protein GX811_03915, partial [Lentisphaerae bacterium]|nr:hypothetical protein [Lentisphaerota bacterium]
GEYEDYLVLRSSMSGESWHLNVDVNAEQNVENVDTRDSNASSGATILAKNSLGQNQNNQNWTFFTVIPGEQITWTGANNTLWGAIDNWDLGRAPALTDKIVIPAGCTNYPVFDTGREVGDLNIMPGAKVSLNGFNLTVTNELKVAGDLIADATETITVITDLDMTGGNFEAARSTLLLAGVDTRTVKLDNLNYYRIMIGPDVSEVDFIDGFYATELRCEVPTGTKTLTFASGKKFTLRDLYLLGSTDSPSILLRSSNPGTSWLLEVNGHRDVRGVNVSDSDARPGLTIPASYSVNNSGNYNWTFDAEVSTWNGNVNNRFHDPNNWSTGTVPGPGTRVFVDGPNPLTITGTVTILELTIGGGDDAPKVTVNADLEVRENVTLLNNGTLIWNKPGTANNLFIHDGALLTHSQNTATEVYKIDLAIGNAVEIDAGGVIDVTGMGFKGQRNFPPGPGAVGTYGGVSSTHYRADPPPWTVYGSVLAPTNLGSCAAETAHDGGGAVIIKAAKHIRHDGAIYANAYSSATYYSASGGSVWLKTGKLYGIGTIEARAQDVTTTMGGGGRISLVATNKYVDFSQFTGYVTARGSHQSPAFTNANDAGTGTIYWEAGPEEEGKGKVILKNYNKWRTGYTDFPSYTDEVANEADFVVFFVQDGAKMRLRDDFTVGNVWVSSTNELLDLNFKTLYVNAEEHDFPPDTVINYGEIVWWVRPPGTVMFFW